MNELKEEVEVVIGHFSKEVRKEGSKEVELVVIFHDELGLFVSIDGQLAWHHGVKPILYSEILLGKAFLVYGRVESVTREEVYLDDGRLSRVGRRDVAAHLLLNVVAVLPVDVLLHLLFLDVVPSLRLKM